MDMEIDDICSKLMNFYFYQNFHYTYTFKNNLHKNRIGKLVNNIF